MKAETDSAPQVSIIVPVYNVEAYLRRCLNSIEAQTLAAWECICVDDGSPDGCGAILDEYAARDARFVVIHQENGGTSVARNAGLDAARAEYIGFVDPDDWIEPNTYEVALEAARRTGADIVQWGHIAERADGSFPSKKKREGFFDVRQNPKYYFGGMWSKLIKSSLIFENNIRFPAGVRKEQDNDFLVVAYPLAKSCFYVDLNLYHYDTTRESSICHNATREIILEASASHKKSVERVQELCNTRGGGHLEKFIAFYKIAVCKTSPLCYLSPRDYRLCRSTFPEVNKLVPLYFLKTRTKGAFVLLLAVWHLGWLLDARLWLKEKLMRR